MAVNIDESIRVLKKGGVVAHPTDTCYGYACDYFNEKARARLCELKKMSPDKPVSMMLGLVSDISRYSHVSSKAQELIDMYLPGRYTIILPAKEGVFADAKTVGVRVPDHEICRELCKRFGGPLTTTSANISGEPSVYSAEGIIADYVLDGGLLPFNKPSTILKVEGDSTIVVRP